METTYLNPLNNWTRESIPAEIIAEAEKRVAWDNDPNNGYRHGIETILKSVQPNRIVEQLRGNPNNRDVADTVKVREWSYTVDVVTKIYKNGKKKSYTVTYYCYTETLEVLEVGGYYNSFMNG